MHHPETVAEHLASWAVDVKYADLPHDVVAVAKTLILDQIGLQVRGSTLPHVRPVRRRVEEMAARPEAPITGSTVRTTAAEAAYANGTFGASMEFDDAHLVAWHSGSVLVSTALALAEREDSGGKDVLLAVVVGHQVMSTLGGVTTDVMNARGWHGPKTIGGFAAAATAARLLGLGPDTLADAFGIACSDASGTMEYDRSGGEVKRLHAGSAARSGIEAAQLASYGFTGPRTIFEGPRGFFQMFAGKSEYDPLEPLWRQWHIRDTMYRLVPGVATVLPPVDIVADLQSEHAFAWEDVTEIDVGLPAFAVSHGGSIVHPTDSISAHFSLAFALALRLVTGGSAPEDYVNPAMWTDRRIHEVSEKVRVHAHQFDEGMPMLSGHVELRLRDGRVLSRTQAGFRGSPSRPASEADIVAKFRANTATILSPRDTEAVLAAVTGLEDIDNIGDLTQHLIPQDDRTTS